MQMEVLKDPSISVLSRFVNPYETECMCFLTSFAEVSELVAFLFSFFLLSFFFYSQEIISGESEEETNGVNLMEFSDEILLHILSYVPCTDLVLNVRRTCRKLATLCLDKSLTHTVILQKDYKVGRVACFFCCL